jgi:hypothetical protein
MWDISKPPMLELKKPKQQLETSAWAKAIIPEIIGKLEKLPALKDISNIIFKQVSDSINTATFNVVLPEITLMASLPFGKKSATFSSKVLCTARTTPNGLIELAAIHLDFDSSIVNLDFLDQIVNSLIDPILKAVNNMLSGVKIPSVTVEGITLSPPTPVISEGRLILLANLVSKGSPAPIMVPRTWPSQAIFSLASPELINEAIKYGYNKLKIPHEISSSGSQDLGITTAKYMAVLRVESPPKFGIIGENIEVTIQTGGNVSAGITTIFGDVGLNYKVLMQPNPLRCIGRLLQNNSQLILTTPFPPVASLLFVPQGNFGETIISAIFSGGVNLTSLILSQFIPQIIRSIYIPIANIPTIPVDFDKIHLKIQATELKVAGFSGMAMIAGSLNVV